MIAPTKEIADIAFARAAGMIRLDPELAKLFHVQQHIRTITHRRTEAVCKVKAADTDAITGTLASTLVDEVHVFAAHPRAREVYIELRGAFAARADGFLFQITTQSKSPPAGVFRTELGLARAVRDGRLEMPSLLPVLARSDRRSRRPRSAAARL
jgi:phage terminase large subunit-like protein